MKAIRVLKEKKGIVAVMVCIVIAASLVVLPMISAYGEDEPIGYASTSINIHGTKAPIAPSADALSEKATEKAESEAQQAANVPDTGMDTRNVILWISLGLTGFVIVLAVNAIRRMEK